MAIKARSVNKEKHEREIKSMSTLKERKKRSNNMVDAIDLKSIIKKRTMTATGITDTKRMCLPESQESKSVILRSDSAE